jgi:hypothetical protein
MPRHRVGGDGWLGMIQTRATHLMRSFPVRNWNNITPSAHRSALNNPRQRAGMLAQESGKNWGAIRCAPCVEFFLVSQQLGGHVLRSAFERVRAPYQYDKENRIMSEQHQ